MKEVETIHNIQQRTNTLLSSWKRKLFFLILTGIGDEIYSTVDACNTAKEMWTAIERTYKQRGIVDTYKMLRPNLFWDLGSLEVLLQEMRIHGDNKGKEIAKPGYSSIWSVSEEDSDPEQARMVKIAKKLELLDKIF
ncbi:hypothetical protein Tco_0470868 [Tanacetum coccineum]